VPNEFRPLSDIEYEALSRREKIEYLKRAIEAANWRTLLVQAILDRQAKQDPDRDSA
jgi:hypothetical protein